MMTRTIDHVFSHICPTCNSPIHEEIIPKIVVRDWASAREQRDVVDTIWTNGHAVGKWTIKKASRLEIFDAWWERTYWPKRAQ